MNHPLVPVTVGMSAGKVEGATAEEVLQAAAQRAGDASGLTELDADTVEKVEAGIVQAD